MEGEGSKHRIFQKQLKHLMFKMFGNFKKEVDNDEREHAVPSS